MLLKTVKKPFVAICSRSNRILTGLVTLTDIFATPNDTSNCNITSCNARGCKTCPILSTDNSFTSILTNKSYSTHGFGEFNCKTENVIYGIECSMCVLIYVGETQNPLHLRINNHRSGINNNSDQLIYKHFNQPDHSVLSMKVRILEQMYHHYNIIVLN
jgi:hypothetical protein